VGWSFAGFAAALVPGSGRAAEPPLAAPVAGAFASIEALAEDAARRWLPRSVREDRELMGGIFQSLAAPRRFAYSLAIGRRGGDEIHARLRAPAGHRFVALWHAHGAPGRGRELFSARDVRLAGDLGVPIYLLTPAGTLRVYRPGDPVLSVGAARQAGLGWRTTFAEGELASSGRERGMASSEACCSEPAS
jgi:hypothetical protein